MSTSNSSESSPATSTEHAAEGHAHDGFDALGLSPAMLDVVAKLGYSRPTDVQRAVFAPAIAGKDLLVQSRTGTGKTAAYGLPLAEGLLEAEATGVQALVLCPTRELALQIATALEKLVAGHRLKVVAIYGGAPMKPQIDALEKANIVVATPGRALDHLGRKTFRTDKVRVAILDEADEMLRAGFFEDVTAIVDQLPSDRQTMVFSATLPEEIVRLAKQKMQSPETIMLSGDDELPTEIDHIYFMISGMGRTQDLMRVLRLERPERAIIFCNTRDETGKVAEQLKAAGIAVEAISGDLPQSERERVIGRMRSGDLHLLVATDVAARGIDLKDLTHVFHYELPESAEVYVHRSGRTGRAGKKGLAIALVSPRELGQLYYLKLLYKIEPEERSLPSETEIKTRLEGERLETLQSNLPAEPAQEWRALARRVWLSTDGERVIASLLGNWFAGGAAKTGTATAPVAVAKAAPTTAAAPTKESPRPATPKAAPTPSAPSAKIEPNRQVSTQPATSFSGSVPTSPASAASSLGSGAGESSRQQSQKEPRSAAPPERERHTRPGRTGARPSGPNDRLSQPRGHAAPQSATSSTDTSSSRSRATRAPEVETEFWETWAEERSRTARETPPAQPASALEPNVDTGTRTQFVQAVEGDPTDTEYGGEPLVQLYINVGRRDKVGSQKMRAFVEEQADFQPTKLEVKGSHTYLWVPEALAADVITRLSGRELGERAIVCEPARREPREAKETRPPREHREPRPPREPREPRPPREQRQARSPRSASRAEPEAQGEAFEDSPRRGAHAAHAEAPEVPAPTSWDDYPPEDQ